MSRIRSHLARFHPKANWTQAMMMAAIDAHEAELARLRAQVSEKHQEPQPVEIPAFLQSPDIDPPPETSDLIDWTSPPRDRQDALLAKLREVNGLIGLAEDRGGRAAPELYRKRDRIESGLNFNRPTLTETI